jgi:hypothetical protein
VTGAAHSIIPVAELLRLFEVLALFGLVLLFAAGRLSKLTAGQILCDAGLYGVTGRMGRGKSYLLVLAIWWAQRRRRLVFANFEVHGCIEFSEWVALYQAQTFDNEDAGRKSWHGVVWYHNWQQALSAPNKSMVVMDEVQLWWPSKAHDAPVEVEAWITQLRKRGLTVLWATQDFSFAARWLRLLSFGVWECKKFRGGFRYTLVDPTQAGRLGKQLTMARFRVKRRKRVSALYDTLGVVASSREWGASAGPVAGL